MCKGLGVRGLGMFVELFYSFWLSGSWPRHYWALPWEPCFRVLSAPCLEIIPWTQWVLKNGFTQEFLSNTDYMEHSQGDRNLLGFPSLVHKQPTILYLFQLRQSYRVPWLDTPNIAMEINWVSTFEFLGRCSSGCLLISMCSCWKGPFWSVR